MTRFGYQTALERVELQIQSATATADQHSSTKQAQNSDAGRFWNRGDRQAVVKIDRPIKFGP